MEYYLVTVKNVLKVHSTTWIKSQTNKQKTTPPLYANWKNQVTEDCLLVEDPTCEKCPEYIYTESRLVLAGGASGVGLEVIANRSEASLCGKENVLILDYGCIVL